jgi:hypothetical protein
MGLGALEWKIIMYSTSARCSAMYISTTFHVQLPTVHPTFITRLLIQLIIMPRSEASLDGLSSDTSYDADEDYRLAQQEWEESLDQLHQLLSVVVMPFLGKWLGRRWSYWGQLSLCILLLLFLTSHSKAYARYLQLGLGRSFFWLGPKKLV